MIPLYDIKPREKIAYVNVLIILITIGTFIVQLLQPDYDQFIHNWAYIPILFDATDPYSYRYLLASLVMQGSGFIFVVNMWFLMVFGSQVEERLGHLGYLLFYVIAGGMSFLLQSEVIHWQNIPLVGASGAVAAVAGAYLVLQHSSRVAVWFPIGSLKRTMELPAWLALVYWVLAVVVFSFIPVKAINYNLDGVAWWGYAGGFITGAAVGLIVRALQPHKK